MNKKIIKFAVLMLFVMATGYVNADAAGEAEIKTSTVGKTAKLAWPFLAGKISVKSSEAPKMADMLTASFAKSGYTIDNNSVKPTYVIFRMHRGKAADYAPQESSDKSEGAGWVGAFFSLGFNVLVGQKLGLINTSNIRQSDANTLADTARRASDAYGNPTNNADKNAEMATAAEKVKEETNLVVYALCFSGHCAYALSAGEADLDRLDEACYRDGILKLAGQD